MIDTIAPSAPSNALANPAAAGPVARGAPGASPLIRKRRWRRRLTRTGLVLLLLLVVVEVIGFALTDRVAEALVRGPNAGRVMEASGDATAAELQRRGIDRQVRLDVGPPAASLLLWVLEPKRLATPAAEPTAPATTAPTSSPSSPVRGTIVLLHGHLDNKEQLLDAGRAFAAAGYRAVLIDMRSRGRSGGNYLTFGYQEARDASQVLDALQARGVALGPVGFFGRSYGGAAAIQAAAIDPRVRAVVAVSSFSSMRQAFHDASRRVLPLPVRLLWGWRIDPVVDAAGRTGGFDPDAASPLRAIAQTKAAVLLFHGTSDVYVPPAHSRRLHDAAPGHSKLVLVEAKDHNDIMDYESGPVLIRESVEWFDTHLGANLGANP